MSAGVEREAGRFEAAELVEWAEKYGHPEEWAKRAQAAHGRAEKAEADLATANSRIEELEGAIREHRERYLTLDDYPEGDPCPTCRTDQAARDHEASIDRDLWSVLPNRQEGSEKAEQQLRELVDVAGEVVNQWLHDHADGPSGLPRALESLSDLLDRIEGTDKGEATDG